MPYALPVHGRPEIRVQRDDGFYSLTRWRDFRRSYLRRHPLCVECERRGRTEPAVDVDHKISLRSAPALAFDESNMQALCHGHHSQKTRGGG